MPKETNTRYKILSSPSHMKPEAQTSLRKNKEVLAVSNISLVNHYFRSSV